MPINNITQTISELPSAGARGVDVQTIFVTKQEDFQDHLQGITVTELNTLKDQLNLRIGEINSTATTMDGYANTASAGASTATTKAGEASASASQALTSRNQAETFKNNASASATKASQWADNNYNVEVETGRYSAKHWSVVAENVVGDTVKLTGDQTIAGNKTFSSNPISATTQSTATNALTRKDYVDTKVTKVASIDNTIVRFDGYTGEVQDSGVVVDDGGNLLLYNSSQLFLGANQAGGATLNYNANGNLDITPRVGGNTTFTAGNVGIGMINNGADRLQVNGSISVAGNINITSQNTTEITKEITRTAGNATGPGVLASVFGDVPTCGELYVYEIGTENYLNATFFKRGASYTAVVTVLASNGLTLGTSNTSGTQNVSGATDGNNVRMMAKIRKLYT